MTDTVQVSFIAPDDAQAMKLVAQLCQHRCVVTGALALDGAAEAVRRHIEVAGVGLQVLEHRGARRPGWFIVASAPADMTDTELRHLAEFAGGADAVS